MTRCAIFADYKPIIRRFVVILLVVLFCAPTIALAGGGPENVLLIIDPTNALVRNPVYWGPWGVTLLLFLVGLAIRIFGERRYDVVLWLFLMGSTMTQVVFFVIPRLRYPLYPIIFLFAAQGFYFLLQKTKPKSRSTALY